MSLRRKQTTTLIDLYKKVQKEQRNAVRLLYHDYQMQTQTLSAAYEATYKDLITPEERAFLLSTFVQARSQLRQTFTIKHKHLLTQQSGQLENLLINLAGFVKRHKQERTKSARIVIEAAIKSGTLCIALPHQTVTDT